MQICSKKIVAYESWRLHRPSCVRTNVSSCELWGNVRQHLFAFACLIRSKQIIIAHSVWHSAPHWWSRTYSAGWVLLNWKQGITRFRPYGHIDCSLLIFCYLETFIAPKFFELRILVRSMKNRLKVMIQIIVANICTAPVLHFVRNKRYAQSVARGDYPRENLLASFMWHGAAQRSIFPLRWAVENEIV